MNLIVRIPEEIVERLGASGADLERQALEALVLEKYRAGLSQPPRCRFVNSWRWLRHGWKDGATHQLSKSFRLILTRASALRSDWRKRSETHCR